MFTSSQHICRMLSELRLSVPKLSVRSPQLLSVNHLRTGQGPTTRYNQVKLNDQEDGLPSGQSIVKTDSELRDETLGKINSQLDQGPGRLFAVVHVRGFQHKVTDGDLVMVKTDLGASIGKKIILQKLLALGGRDFTLLGTPVLPLDLANIEATVIEKSLSRTKVHQFFKKRERKRWMTFNRTRQTLLRINSINVTGRVGQTADISGCEKYVYLS